MLDIPVAPVLTKKELVADQDVKEAITRASLASGWSIQDDPPGRLIATKTEDGQTAIVTIGYQMSMYSIRYRESRGSGLRHGIAKSALGRFSVAP
jgi:hypothetical protein